MWHSFSFSYGIFPTAFFLRHYSFCCSPTALLLRHYSYGITLSASFLRHHYTPSLFLPLSYGLSLKAIISFMGNCLCIVNMLYNLYVHISIFDISFVHKFYFAFSILYAILQSSCAPHFTRRLTFSSTQEIWSKIVYVLQHEGLRKVPLELHSKNSILAFLSKKACLIYLWHCWFVGLNMKTKCQFQNVNFKISKSKDCILKSCRREVTQATCQVLKIPWFGRSEHNF